ncbi:hypothetical protein MVEN_01754100 [Mycena venus]|uniref:Uncharacterized protein n=1 Tax=Mycena venus TaxID=2733690 RepID=A0A8H7CP90_9AGAR|nr:hypothetical protein MVEN_01754100 [Mycena venus]
MQIAPPKNFIPMEWYKRTDISDLHYDPGTFVSTSTVQKVDVDAPFDQFPGGDFVFSCDSLQGAVLALPDGAQLRKLDNLENMRAYAAKHAGSWYEYVNGERGRGLANGDLYLVTGCEKARSWGMASYHTAHEEFEIAFKPTVRADTPYEPYQWSGTPGRRNPSRKKGYDPPPNAPVNQTTFIHGWSISLPTGLWGKLFGTAETSSIVDFQSRLNTTSGSYTASSQGLFSSWSWSLFGGGGSTRGNRRAAQNEDVALTDFSPTASAHPTTVVMTHDDEWRNILGDSEVSNLSQLLQRIDDGFTITERDDATFLVSKSADPGTPSMDDIPTLADLHTVPASETNFLESIHEEFESPQNPDDQNWIEGKTSSLPLPTSSSLIPGQPAFTQPSSSSILHPAVSSSTSHGGPVPFPHWQPPAQQPTCTNIRIRSVEDAHKIFYAIRSDILRMVSRRLNSDERAALRTGCVYAWEERSPNTEITGIGIERFTEGRRWSASRVRDEFLFYYEKFVPDPNHATRNEPMGWEQLVKQTYSVWVETEKGRRKWHLTAYFTQTTVDQLGTVDDIPEVRALVVPSGIFTSTRVGKRKNADSDSASQTTVARFYAPFPSPLPPLAPRPVKSTSVADRPPSPSVRMYEPYSRPQSRTQVQSPTKSPTTYGPESQPYAHAGPSTSQLRLHYSYPSPPQNSSPPASSSSHNYTRRTGSDYSQPGPEIHERPPVPTSAQPYSNDTAAPHCTFSTTRVCLAPHRSANHESQPQPQPEQTSGRWITSPMVSYQPRSGSPRSDYNSSSSSSSSYASSPTAPLHPLLPEFEPGSNGPDILSLSHLQMPIDPTPTVLVSSPTDHSERAGDRDLAPLNSLTRFHPYRRDPTDEKTLRLLEPHSFL